MNTTIAAAGKAAHDSSKEPIPVRYPVIGFWMAASLIARKEAGELLLSLRGLAWLMAMTVVLSAFCLLLVSDTELGLLDNAEVVYDMAGIVTALGALLALIIGIDTVAGERERGSLVPLLLTPAPRDGILMGKLGGIVFAWIAMYGLALPYFWSVGSTGQNLIDGMMTVAMLGTPVVLSFGMFGMGLGARTESARTGLLVGVIILMLLASPFLLGPSLRQSVIGHAFDAVNPFSAAVNAYDAVVIDSQVLLSQATNFGVAVFWLALTFWFARTGLRRVGGQRRS